MNIIVMGVSGSGKTTIGKKLGKALDLPFFDGDDFHPQANVAKMQRGEPLNDDDRLPWLERLVQLIKDENGLILVCSALKKKYRELLGQGGKITWILLQGTQEQIQQRMNARKGHYMPPSLLQSQFDTLEVPEDAIKADISKNPEEIVSSLLNQIRN